MSLSQISERTSSTAMNNLDEEKLEQYQCDSVIDIAIMVAELAKQLGNEQQSLSIKSQLQSIYNLEKTCGKLLGALQALKESLTSRSSCAIQSKPAISLLTVE